MAAFFELLKYFIPFTKYPYQGESIGCPVCSCDRGTQIASLDRRFKYLPTFACDNCGLLFINPMPTDSELSNYYTRLYRLDYQGASDKPRERHLRKRIVEAESRAAFLNPLLKPNSRTLDFGCGTGEFVTALLSLGHDAHGFEPGKTYGEYARTIHGERVQVQGWQQASYAGAFDAVTCFHVLEHLRDPMAAIKQMAQWTYPNGLVYIEVPDLSVLLSGKGFGGFHFAHLIGFNHHNLLLAGKINGLRPRSVIGQTGIIFEHGVAESQVQEAEKGRALTSSLCGTRRMLGNYCRYQLGKLFR